MLQSLHHVYSIDVIDGPYALVNQGRTTSFNSIFGYGLTGRTTAFDAVNDWVRIPLPKPKQPYY